MANPVCSCGSTDFTEGFCDSCGKPEPGVAVAPVAPPPGIATLPAVGGGGSQVTGTGTGVGSGAVARGATTQVHGYARTGSARVTGARRPTPPSGSAVASGTAPGSGPTGTRGTGTGSTRRGSRGSSSRRKALGGGLVQMPVMPSLDPLTKLMVNPRVPDSKCFCPNCKNKVNPDKRFCSNCGAEYSFKPSLSAGDTVAGQYEIKGAMAFGGLGWIYLGMDIKLNRWVVLKGLLNAKDEAAAAAAVAERQFLAAVKFGKIVGVYNFVTHGTESYIVMEYVGGRTWKDIRKERGPLPVEEAIAYVLGILPAFGYLHAQGMVYCDFKPDNAMAEDDDVKLIDMGGVRRIGDPDGDVYGTVGYMAPEAGDDPSVTSDLYTVARSLLVLIADFDNTRKFKHELPPPNELMHIVPDAALGASGAEMACRAAMADGSALPGWLAFDFDAKGNRWYFHGTAPEGVSELQVQVHARPASDASAAGTWLPMTLRLPLAQNESLYRFLSKATDPVPDNRFQSADEMAAQLLGVLREIVALHAPIPSQEDPEFMPEREVPGTSPLSFSDGWKRLPEVRLDREDTAAAEVFAAATAPDASSAAEILTRAIKSKPDSSEAQLRLADLLITATDGPSGRTEAAEASRMVMPHLDAAAGTDPFDWRPDWYCGKLYMATGMFTEAVECFDRVYSAIPGTPHARVGLAMALEGEKRNAEAAGLYDAVSRTDPSVTAASFGLARCRSTLGERAGAVEALSRVPASAANHGEAQLASARILGSTEKTQPAVADLVAASRILEGLKREDTVRYEAEADLALTAADVARATPSRGEKVLGQPLTHKAQRKRAAAALLTCAKLSRDRAERFSYADRAHAVAPRRVFGLA
jgi:serine/threonine protein kinase